jgi:lysophospholipase L1-like esterase
MMTKHGVRCGVLLSGFLALAMAAQADTTPSLRAGTMEERVTGEDGTWLVHMEEPRAMLRVPYVREPASVTLQRTGATLGFTYEDETLTVTLPEDIAQGDVVSIAFEHIRWASAMDQFDAENANTPPPESAALFVGSSSIRLWNLEEAFPGMATINRGFGGSEYGDMLRFAGRLFKPYAPRVIVLYSGDNDIAAGKSAAWVLADFTALIARIRHDLPETPIVVLGIKPSIARWELWPMMQEANMGMAKHCAATENMVYIDTATPLLGEDGKPRTELLKKDGLHLNDAGYAPWAALVREHIAPRAEKQRQDSPE